MPCVLWEPSQRLPTAGEHSDHAACHAVQDDVQCSSSTRLCAPVTRNQRVQLVRCSHCLSMLRNQISFSVGTMNANA